MNITTSNFLLLITALTSGLIAGLFYAYSCSVNPGLGRLSDGEYLAAMQSINRVILNPIFFASFMGTFFLLPISAFVNRTVPGSSTFILLTAAAAIYIIGTFSVTIFGNVPLNNALDAFNLDNASATDLAKHRAFFETSWNKLHQVRTICSIISFVLVLLTCIGKSGLART